MIEAFFYQIIKTKTIQDYTEIIDVRNSKICSSKSRIKKELNAKTNQSFMFISCLN
jgi:hypothetical protein